jgi:hypothetical protein
VLYSKEWDMSTSCPTRGKQLRLQTMGHTITGGGFYNIEVDPIKKHGSGEVFAAIIKFPDCVLTAEQLSGELKNLVDDLWDSQVNKLTETEFSVAFRSRATL